MPNLLHHPPHVYQDDTWYMITSSTFGNHPIIQTDGHKQLLQNQIKQIAQDFDFKLTAWVILDNHYHLLLKIKESSELSNFFRRLHGRTSFEFNKREKTPGRRVWHNYWDTLIRNEKDYWTRFNYLHHNPVKHGYVDKIEDWQHSSYHDYLEKEGEEWLADVNRKYPIIDFTDPNDRY